MSVEAFLAALDCARPLVAAPAVAAAWQQSSALADLSVGALTAHLTEGIATVDSRLDRPVPDGVDTIDAVAYYLPTLHGETTSASVREATIVRDAEGALLGPAALLVRLDDARDRLRSRLLVEPPERLIRVAGGRYMRLIDFLVTRTVEVAVHSDDLAASVGLPSPTFPAEVGDTVITVLVGMCRRRHGDTAVVRGFTRRERDTVEALRVF